MSKDRLQAFFENHPNSLGQLLKADLAIPWVVFQNREVFPQVNNFLDFGSIVICIINHRIDLDWPLVYQRVIKPYLRVKPYDVKVVASVKHLGQKSINELGLGPSKESEGVEALSPQSVLASDQYESLMGYKRVYVVQ